MKENSNVRYYLIWKANFVWHLRLDPKSGMTLKKILVLDCIGNLVVVELKREGALIHKQGHYFPHGI